MPWGTIINVVAVIIGSLIGLAFRNILHDRFKAIVFQALGLITVVLGISMAIQMRNPLIVIFSLILGGLLGEASRLDSKIEKLADKAKTRFKFKDENFSEGLITAFVLFCIGSLTILGALQEGTTGNNSLLVTKSLLDGFSSIALAATFGQGVLFSVIPMLIFQGGLTILASYVGKFFSSELIYYLSAVGGILILGIGINLLEIKKIKVLTFLPALLLVVVFYLVLTQLGVSV